MASSNKPSIPTQPIEEWLKSEEVLRILRLGRNRFYESIRRRYDTVSSFWSCYSRSSIGRLHPTALEAEAQAADPGEPGAPHRGRPRQMPPGVPPPTAQRNFTDPDSRIMKDADKAFIQGYNAQAAVNAHAQVIAKVHAEWTLICLTQNLLTLYRSGRRIPA